MPPSYGCPDCGRQFNDSTALAEHAVTEHVQTPTPAAHIRRPRLTGFAGGLVAGLGIVAGLALWGVLIFDLAGGFDKATVEQTPGSVVHKAAVELEAGGVIEDFRAVEPGDWDVEYELYEESGGVADATIRIRDERTVFEELEFEAFSDELYDAIEAELSRRGFEFEEGS